MKKEMKTYKLLIMLLLMSCACFSCSDNELEVEPTGKAGSISFSLNGLESGIVMNSETKTRANISSIPFDQYAVKLFVFKRFDKASEHWEGFELEREAQDVTTSLVTVDNIEAESDYFFVFLAVPIEFSTDLILKTGMTEPKNAMISKGIGTGTDPRYCYIPVFQEPSIDLGEIFDGPSFTEDLKVKTSSSSTEFMIYGWSISLPGIENEGAYTPQNVVLTPQLGAIEFVAGDVGTITSCSVYSNFYRFYLSQMTGEAATTINEIPEDENLYVMSDLMGNYYVPQNIDKTFPSGTTRYNVFVPCSTLKDASEIIPDEEKANTYAGTESGTAGAPSYSTSVTINSKTYATTEPFPVFPKRVTVLKVNDGSLVQIGFKNMDGGGVNLEDDVWDGIQ